MLIADHIKARAAQQAAPSRQRVLCDPKMPANWKPQDIAKSLAEQITTEGSAK